VLRILVLMTVLNSNKGAHYGRLDAALIVVALLIHRHYRYTGRLLRRLDDLVDIAATETGMVRRAVEARTRLQPRPRPR